MAIDRYSTIKKQPEKAGSPMLTDFYSKAISPTTLWTLLPAWFTILWAGDLKHLKMLSDTSQGHLCALMIVFTCVMGTRLFHSIWLASKDYRALEQSLSDLIMFLAIGVFTSGIAFKRYGFEDSHDVAGFYALLAVLGVINFAYLYAIRMPAKEEYLDLFFEKRIQIFNTITFLIVVMVMGYVWFVTKSPGASLKLAELAVGLTCILLCLNIVHSDQLTWMPKFLISNNCDALDDTVKRFRAMFPVAAKAIAEETIRKDLLGPEYAKFQPLSLIRATKDDAPLIAELLVAEFGYLYRFIFCTDDEAKIKKFLVRMLCLFGGFGFMGLSNIYAVVGQDDTLAGYITLESAAQAGLYNALKKIALLPGLVRTFGRANLAEIHRRVRTVASLQPKAKSNEDVILSILVIRDDVRRRGFAYSTGQLLINAIAAKANGVQATRIRSIVRTHNAASLALFQTLGFKTTDKRRSAAQIDPFRDDPAIGEAVYFIYEIVPER